MRRTRRRIAAWAVILGLVMAQVTALAHACPLIEMALPAPATPMAMSGPCPGMDRKPSVEVTAPCAEHCQFGAQAASTTSADQPVHARSAFLVVAARVDRPVDALRVQDLLARTTAPPVFASSSRLRI